MKLARPWKFGLLLAAAWALLAFQNCSQPIDNSGSLDANSLLAQKMDLAYDASLDQITYMSCPALTGAYDTDPYFTLRAGAYRMSGGLKLADSFFINFAKKTPDRMADLLTLSPVNAHTVLQVAVRNSGNLNSVANNSGAPKAGVDYQNLLSELGTTEMSTALVKLGLDYDKGVITQKTMRYMRDGTFRGAHMEASLQFGSAESVMADLRTKLMSGGHVLAMTYVQPSQGGAADTDVKRPVTTSLAQIASPSIAYGVGFQMNFSQPPGAKGRIDKDTNGNTIPGGKELDPYPMNLMTGVSERSLNPQGTKTTPGTWTCPNTLRFRIVRADDLVEGNCKRVPDPDPITMNTPAYAEFKIARNSLRAEDWYIDWTNKCIIPKKSGSSCYGSLSYVQYNYTDATSATAGCDPNSNASSNSLKSPVCLAWASVCYRN